MTPINKISGIAIIAHFAIAMSYSFAAEIEIVDHNSKEVLLLDKAGLHINGWFVHGIIEVKKIDDDSLDSADYKLAIADIKADCIKNKLIINAVSYYNDENALKPNTDKGRGDISSDFDDSRQQVLIHKLCAQLR